MRVTFFCFAKRKSPKKRRPPVCDPFAVRRGKPAACRLRGAPQNSLRAGALRSDNCGESVHEAWALRRPCSPRNRPAAGAASRGGAAEHPNSQRPFGPSLRSAAPAQRGALAPASGGRAKQRPEWLFGSLCPSGCAEHRRLPRRAAAGTQTVGSPFFWVLFFGEAKKSTSPAGATPGLRHHNRHAAKSAHATKHY